jgi:hypothetical protein
MHNYRRGEATTVEEGRWSQMTKCAAFTAKGRPCKGLVRAGSDYCPAHDPARADARRRSASKAARSKLGGEVRDLKDRLGTLAEDVLAGRVEPKVAAVLTQIIGAYARLLEFERKFREQDEFEARLVALEVGVRKRWGA